MLRRIPSSPASGVSLNQLKEQRATSNLRTKSTGSLAKGKLSYEDVVQHAVYLGMDPDADSDLLWIAEESLRAPVPADYRLKQDDHGVYYVHRRTKRRTRSHPADTYYRNLYFRKKAERRRHLLSDDSVNPAPLPRPRPTDPEESAPPPQPWGYSGLLQSVSRYLWPQQEGESQSPVANGYDLGVGPRACVGPTPKSVVDTASNLGIDMGSECHLLWIARALAHDPLPPQWSKISDSEGIATFVNRASGKVRSTRPIPFIFVAMLRHARAHPQEYRRRLSARASSSPSNTSATSSEAWPCVWQPFVRRDGTTAYVRFPGGVVRDRDLPPEEPYMDMALVALRRENTETAVEAAYAVTIQRWYRWCLSQRSVRRKLRKGLSRSRVSETPSAGTARPALKTSGRLIQRSNGGARRAAEEASEEKGVPGEKKRVGDVAAEEASKSRRERRVRFADEGENGDIDGECVAEEAGATRSPAAVSEGPIPQSPSLSIQSDQSTDDEAGSTGVDDMPLVDIASLSAGHHPQASTGPDDPRISLASPTAEISSLRARVQHLEAEVQSASDSLRRERARLLSKRVECDEFRATIETLQLTQSEGAEETAALQAQVRSLAEAGKRQRAEVERLTSLLRDRETAVEAMELQHAGEVAKLRDVGTRQAQEKLLPGGGTPCGGAGPAVEAELQTVKENRDASNLGAKTPPDADILPLKDVVRLQADLDKSQARAAEAEAQTTRLQQKVSMQAGELSQQREEVVALEAELEEARQKASAAASEEMRVAQARAAAAESRLAAQAADLAKESGVVAALQEDLAKQVDEIACLQARLAATESDAQRLAEAQTTAAKAQQEVSYLTAKLEECGQAEAERQRLAGLVASQADQLLAYEEKLKDYDAMAARLRESEEQVCNRPPPEKRAFVVPPGKVLVDEAQYEALEALLEGRNVEVARLQRQLDRLRES
eukprot:Rmarinus@m.1092